MYLWVMKGKLYLRTFIFNEDVKQVLFNLDSSPEQNETWTLGTCTHWRVVISFSGGHIYVCIELKELHHRKNDWMMQIIIFQVWPLSWLLLNESCMSFTERKVTDDMCCLFCFHTNDKTIEKCVFNAIRLNIPNISKHFWCYHWRYW